MESWLLLYGLITLTIIDLIQVIRMVFGPLSEYVCWIEIFWRNGPTQGAILCLDVIIVFRVIITLCCLGYPQRLVILFPQFCPADKK